MAFEIAGISPCVSITADVALTSDPQLKARMDIYVQVKLGPAALSLLVCIQEVFGS
jgi:hypothetical protein